jgi:hypothetical protein
MNGNDSGRTRVNDACFVLGQRFERPTENTASPDGWFNGTRWLDP